MDRLKRKFEQFFGQVQKQTKRYYKGEDRMMWKVKYEDNQGYKNEEELSMFGQLVILAAMSKPEMTLREFIDKIYEANKEHLLKYGRDIFSIWLDVDELGDFTDSEIEVLQKVFGFDILKRGAEDEGQNSQGNLRDEQ